MSIPINLTNLMVLMNDDLSDPAKSDYIRAVVHFSKDPPRYEGANGTWQAHVWVMIGILL